MAKFRSKLKGQTKGKRWPKGQSSSSNPQTKKYRDLAKSRFFQENLGPSNLTSDALRKHDALASYATPKIPTEPSEMDEDIESEGTTYRTIQTFASNWSECSNASFSRLLHVFKSDSVMHKEMLAVLAAVTEVIKQNGGTESTTEYYAALMTTLEVTETEISLAAVLSLLTMGIKSVPRSVLRIQFSTATKTFIDLLERNSDSDNTTILRSILSLLTSLLRAQELAVWSSISTLKIFGSILAFTCHSKPKVRKVAHHGVGSVLKGSCFMVDDPENAPANHPAAAHVANFCIQQIEASTGAAGQTTTLHTLALLKDVIHTFPKAQIKSTCETILKIMTMNNPLINSCGMQVLHSLFSAQSTTMPAILNGQLISALYDYQPSVTDVQPTLAWIAVMQQAHVHLADVDVSVSSSIFPKIITTLCQLWLSERPEVMNGTTHALQVIFEDCIGPACATEIVAKTSETNLQKCFSAVESCLGYQYNKAWHQVLHIISIMFKVAGKHCGHLLINCLTQLAELRDSYKFVYNTEVENAVGAAVKSLGPQVVLNIINLTKSNGEVNLDRSWLLPVLKENIEYSTLEYFAKTILPLAMMCQRKSIELSSKNDGIGAHSYELLYTQLWNLLPSFCKYPSDVHENFKNIAKILGSAISERKELRLAVMSSLRRLIQNAKETENEKEKEELSRFAKNYLPILFNLYSVKPNGTDEEGQRLAALDTVKDYLSISSPELTHNLFNNALSTLKSKTDPDDKFLKESILDLIRTLIPYQPLTSLVELYNQCIKDLLKLNNKEQKKAYKLLEAIFNSDSEACKKFLHENRNKIQKLLLNSLSSAAVTSRAARLKCQNNLVKMQPHLRHDSKFFRAITPEAILCCKDINEKCRLAAKNLLISIGETLEKHNQMKQYLGLVMAGLGGTTEMVSGTLLALATITDNFSSALGPENLKLLLETVGQLLTSSTREIVAAGLVYIKIFISSIPSPVVGTFLQDIVKPLTDMTKDCQKHFQIRVRDILAKLIRKFGCDAISPLIPDSDVVMHKRLRNLRKIYARKKKQKDARKKVEKEENSDDEEFTVKAKPRSMEEILADSDSDFSESEDVDSKPLNKRKMQTWIKEDPENIVDFTDPSAVSKITATKPGQALVQNPAKTKVENRGFKIGSDGRLIINDNGGYDDDEDDNDYDAIKFNSDSDSDDDNKSAAETAIIGSKKRKRTDTESMRSGVSGGRPAMKYRAGGSGIHRPLQKPGAEYRSKKAQGDVKQKGKLDPYAYLPLTKTLLNKRKRVKSSGQFKNIVRAAKNGARKGTKAGRISKR